MNIEKIQKLKSINEKIWNCRECSFHEDLIKYHITYRPDAPVQESSKDYQAIVVGINPSWNDSAYDQLSKLYRIDTFEVFEKEILKSFKAQDARNNYAVKLAATFNLLNTHLNLIPGQTLDAGTVYDYVFWSNLSFCGSQKVHIRKMGGKEVGCRVLSEEIHNCLDQNYLSEIIKILDPSLIVFFASGISSVLYFRLLLKKLFQLDSYSEIAGKAFSLPAQVRDGRDVNVEIIASKVANRKIIFLPHPNYHFKSDYKETAIKTVCQWF